jgi:transcription termination/antitermination protein NusA
MNNPSVVEALSQIAREKNVDREMVVETLADALLSAAKKRYGNTDNYEAKIDPTTGSMEVVRLRTVVDEVEDEGLELDLEEASEIDPQAQVGSVVRESLDFAEFGRNAIQAAKQILVQRVREAERERIYHEFSGRVGQIESGTVQQISHGDIVLSLGRAEAAVPFKEQIRRERYRQGDTVRGYIYEVLQVSRGPQVLLSRTHPELLRKLFAIEVPEIAEGIVTIHAVAREPGERAKIAVSSNDDRVDPVGACVGVKGSRVQAIVREVSGERIDIVPWIDEPDIFIARALSPASVLRVILDQRRKHAIVLVEEGQLSLAIGRSGQNSRLAVQLTRWGLDIITEAQYQERRVRIDATQQVFRAMSGISELIALSLATSGFLTVKEIAEGTTELLLTVPGLEEEAKVASVQEAAIAFLAENSDLPGVDRPIETVASAVEPDVAEARTDDVAEPAQSTTETGATDAMEEGSDVAEDQEKGAEVAAESAEVQGEDDVAVAPDASATEADTVPSATTSEDTDQAREDATTAL